MDIGRPILRFLFAAIVVAAVSPVFGQETLDTRRPKVALVLEGGGAKGVAHIGVLRVLERAGIPIDIITGTSMGSIVGGLYAIGYDAAALDSLVTAQDWQYLLGDKLEQYSPLLHNRKQQNSYIFSRLVTLDGGKVVSNTGGFVEGRNLERLFAQLTSAYPDSMSFDDLPIPFACVATNIMDNTEYDFRSGRLAEAMRASMSIPGVFSPIRKGDMVLVDGGLRNNYPADIAKAMGADVIIGVIVDEEDKTPGELRSSLDVLMQVVSVNCKNKFEENVQITDIPIRVDVHGYSMMSFNAAALDTLIRRGETAAMAHRDELVALRKRLGVDDDEASKRRNDIATARHKATTAATEGHNASDTRAKYSYLYGSVGARFDSEEIVALQLYAAFAPKARPYTLETALRLGKRIQWQTDFRLLPVSYGQMRATYIFRHNDMYIYEQGERQTSVMYNQHTVEISPLTFNARNFNFDVGLRWEYYDYKNYLTKRTTEDTDDSKNFVSYYACVDYNSEDDWYFPSRGARFGAKYMFCTDDFATYHDHTGFSELSASWRIAIPLTQRLTLQPMVYGRMLFGSEIPQCRSNTIGGDIFGRYVEQQMPFAGVGRIEYADDNFLAVQMMASQRIATNNFVQLRVAMAGQSDRLSDIVAGSLLLGTQIAYYYRSVLGPLGITAGWSNVTDNLHLYITLGCEF